MFFSLFSIKEKHGKRHNGVFNGKALFHVPADCLRA
jgi:hypothetical protein